LLELARKIPVIVDREKGEWRTTWNNINIAQTIEAIIVNYQL